MAKPYDYCINLLPHQVTVRHYTFSYVMSYLELLPQLFKLMTNLIPYRFLMLYFLRLFSNKLQMHLQKCCTIIHVVKRIVLVTERSYRKGNIFERMYIGSSVCVQPTNINEFTKSKPHIVQYTTYVSISIPNISLRKIIVW